MPWTRNKTRNRNAWMWVAIAAVAFTSVARAETGLQSAKGYAHPVLRVPGPKSEPEPRRALRCLCGSRISVPGARPIPCCATPAPAH